MFTILFFVFKSIEVLIQRRTESFVVFISCLSKVRDMETSVNHVTIKCQLKVDLSGLLPQSGQGTRVEEAGALALQRRSP